MHRVAGNLAQRIPAIRRLVERVRSAEAACRVADGSRDAADADRRAAEALCDAAEAACRAVQAESAAADIARDEAAALTDADEGEEAAALRQRDAADVAHATASLRRDAADAAHRAALDRLAMAQAALREAARLHAAAEARRRKLDARREDTEQAHRRTVSQNEALHERLLEARRQQAEIDADPASLPLLIHRLRRLNERIRSLTGAEEANRLVERDGLGLYLPTLLHPGMAALPVDERRAVMRNICSVIMMRGNRHAPLVGYGLAAMLERVLAAPEPDLSEILEIYDALYGLFWVAAANLAQMAPFDDCAVRPVARYLRERQFRDRATPLLPPAPAGRRLRVCYCAHYATWDRGNAVGPLVWSIVKYHRQLFGVDHELHLYAVQFFDDRFLDETRSLGVTVRAFPGSGTPEYLERLSEQFAADAFDVVLTDIASGAMTYIYESRVAPLQMWLEMGYPYWSIENLDWTFLGCKNHQPHFGVRGDACGLIRFRQDPSQALTPVDAATLAALRGDYPPGAPLFGVFGRLTKLTYDYLAVAEAILAACPAAHLIIAGNGDANPINRYFDGSAAATRVHVFDSHVDLTAYGALIDVFLDTFPFPGGNTVREILSLGKPVVAFDSEDWPDVIAQERDPQLVAHTAADYVTKAVQLLDDPGHYAERSHAAQALAAQRFSPEETVAEIGRVLARFTPETTWTL